MVDQSQVQESRRLYANPDHPVFQLVPPDFQAMAEGIYSALGSPNLTKNNVWDVYKAMYGVFQQIDSLPAQVEIWVQERERTDVERQMPYNLWPDAEN
jgi:hypothetical protein